MNARHAGLVAIFVGASALLAGCERPPMHSTQSGYRGLAMGQVVNPRLNAVVQERQALPAAVPDVPSPPGSPLAKDVYKNVPVLGELPVGEFTRLMLQITAWVSPEKGCAYCHTEGDDLSSDKLYTKLVSRRMLTMTRQINTRWTSHVAQTGVTCYTCHRGKPVPAALWFDEPEGRRAGGTTPVGFGQNHPSRQAGLTALDRNVLARYLLGNEPIRTAGAAALPQGSTTTIRQTENSFGLMIHMSEALGVNCTHCHNTRSHVDWSGSPMARTTAFHGIRMARELNNEHLLPLTGVFPKERLGPTGDVAKISCATCHQGVNKPLNGAPLAQDSPALSARLVPVSTTTAAPTAATPAPPPAAGAKP